MKVRAAGYVKQGWIQRLPAEYQELAKQLRKKIRDRGELRRLVEEQIAADKRRKRLADGSA